MASTGPTVSKSKTNHKVLSSQAIYETVKVSYEYMIQGFSLAKGIGVGKYRESGRFPVGDGSNQANQEYVSVFLEIVSPGEVRATVEFTLLDQTENGKHGAHKNSECAKTFNTGVSKSWYVRVLIPIPLVLIFFLNNLSAVLWVILRSC
ncbi:hypothetical protein MKX03_028014 [Papaver bracteatum]|nr:hypothetical protein MKX03_028014 [Papaver bracteatum]